eukprot:scaffold119827_cov45-Phaeocystis_antarctica.AAC.2
MLQVCVSSGSTSASTVALVRPTTVVSMRSPEKSAASTRLSSCSRASSDSSREATASTSTSTSTSAPAPTSVAVPQSISETGAASRLQAPPW